MLRLRGLSVLLGAVTSLVVTLFEPFLGQPALGSIFLWRILLQRTTRKI